MVLNAIFILFNVVWLSGIGWMILKVTAIDEDTRLLSGNAFWVGWAAVIAVLQIWHFFLPVNALLLVVLTAVSAAGWLIFLRRANLKEIFTARHLIFAGVMLLPLFILSNHVMFAEPSYDHGLYHFQTVKWFNQFPLVRGLGNLHHRLAFNSSNLLAGALDNSGALQGFGFYFTNPTMIFVLLVQLFWSLMIWIKQLDRKHAHYLFYALMLPVALWQASVYPLAGYSADVIIFALQVVLAGKFLNLFGHMDDEKLFGQRALDMCILVAAGITVKLSFVVFGAALMVCVLAVWYKSFYQQSGAHFRTPLKWFWVLLIWLLPWLGRNLMMSGYLLYPSSLISLPVQWKMPPFLINDISSGITLWARTYSGQITYSGDLAWFATWLIRFVYEPRQAFILGILLLGALVVFSKVTRKKIGIAKEYLMLGVVSLLSLIFWFISAPTYRFSGAAFGIFCFAVILAVYRTICERWGEITAARFSFLFIIFMFYSLRPEFSRNISPSRLLFPVNEIQIAEQQQPLAGMDSNTTTSGLIVNVPPEQNPESCWNFPLPCTTRNDFVERLQLIDAQDLGSGFFIPESP